MIIGPTMMIMVVIIILITITWILRVFGLGTQAGTQTNLWRSIFSKTALREVRLIARNTRNENNFYPSHEIWMGSLS
jgi:hypothetical protein